MNQIVRKSIVLIAVLFAFGSTSSVEAQEWARKMLTEYSHDFGEVQKGEMPEYRFELKNVYEETINIAQVFSSCGCTQVSVDKRQLKTWETAEIVCRFNSKPFNGFKEATVTVRFGQPMVGEVQLTVKGTIVSAIRMNPESINFGQVTRGKLPVYKTTLTGPPNANFQIVDIKSTFPHIGVALENPVRTQVEPNSVHAKNTSERFRSGRFQPRRLIHRRPRRNPATTTATQVFCQTRFERQTEPFGFDNDER